MKKTIHILSALTLSLASCETIVDVELPEEPSKLVVNSYFSPDSTWEVSISASKPILNDDPLPMIFNATVHVTGDDGSSYELQPSLGEPGYYTSPDLPKVNTGYRVSVSAPGYEAVSATGSAPPAVEIIRVDTSSNTLNGFRELELDIVFRDPSGVQNFYRIDLYYWLRIPSQEGDTQEVLQRIPFFFANEEVFAGGETSNIFEDTPFDGREYTLSLNIESGEFGYLAFLADSLPFTGPVHLITELRSLSRDYFLYETTLDRYLFSSGDPFSQPAQVFNNVNEGYGIFAGFSAHRDSMRLN